MLGRREFVATGLSSLLLAAMDTSARAGTSYVQACLAACAESKRACNLSAAHCAALVAEGKSEYRAIQRVCEDCSSICTAASAVVAREEGRRSKTTTTICIACANVCTACAVECEKVPADVVLAECAKACRAAASLLHIPTYGC